MTVIAGQFLWRRGTAASWTSTNPVLGAGEPGMETDTNKFKLGNGSTTWNALAYQGGSGGGTSSPVTTVQGRVGDVSITKADVGLGSVDNVADTAKPVSAAQQAAINTKAPIASPTFTGTVSGVTAAMVGLGNVANTAPASLPVSTAQQAALDLKVTASQLDALVAALINNSSTATRAAIAALIGSGSTTPTTSSGLGASSLGTNPLGA